MDDSELRKTLSVNGLKKASEYNWKRAIDEVEEYYKKMAQYSVEK